MIGWPDPGRMDPGRKPKRTSTHVPRRFATKNSLTFWSNARDKGRYQYFIAPHFLRTIKHSERIT